MEIKGGYTNYGQDIGILMMPTVFPRILGDIGNARTFRIPVRYKTVEGVEGFRLDDCKAEEQLLKPFISAAQSLEKEGCKAITTSCSFLAGFQRQLADAVRIPVFTSTLLLGPMVYAMINRTQKVGILTLSPQLITEEIFLQMGWSSKDIPVCISGIPQDSELSQLIIGDHLEGNLKTLSHCMREVTEQHMRNYPETGAILLECQNYSPFAGLIQEVSGVPVFGINQLIEFIDSCIKVRRYGEGMF
ncbi:hypothetical protein U6B65_11525 [Oscillospiraceae bacterium MB08-C2-2]|nr:hypothetical protein U6B65_11525 [Oscillospiraceae bacterium MB08-C2-2]